MVSRAAALVALLAVSSAPAFAQELSSRTFQIRYDATGVTSLRRSSLLPDVPTLDEQGIKDFEIVTWADRPELARGLFEISVEASPDVPGTPVALELQPADPAALEPAPEAGGVARSLVREQGERQVRGTLHLVRDRRRGLRGWRPPSTATGRSR